MLTGSDRRPAKTMTEFVVSSASIAEAGGGAVVLVVLAFVAGGRRGVRSLRQRLLAIGSRLGGALDTDPRSATSSGPPSPPPKPSQTRARMRSASVGRSTPSLPR